jgi:dihydroxyacetone kinase-like protein
METITRADLAPLFERLRDVFVDKRGYLIDLDGKVGDSDLGITMNKGFVAAYESVAANATDALGRTIQMAGMAIAKAAPSTMGTLVATGFMRAGKALEANAGASEIGSAELAIFWGAFLNGVVERGKAKPGDKTIVDVLVPLAESTKASAAAGERLSDALECAAAAAEQGLAATCGMLAQHGKAACFQEKTLGLQDAGATVGFLIAATMRDFVAANPS